ncbi:hypothetical protein [Eubacterium sp.]|uniref:hypothetical protein n=1 Tax=Eubacterium sp. TaxID=142586 RepID=UPI0026E0A8C3|nr:hypothetical protein [Eubacterium sp.]MDO5433844.1 hypothetical protein [Eubacterium sp.]
MGNEVEPISYEIVQVDEMQKFYNFLNEAKNGNPKLSISIIPNVVKDIASVALDFKKVKIENKQFEKKCQLLDKVLDLKGYEVQKNYEARIYEIEAKKEIELSKIENDTKKILKQINSELEIALCKIQTEEKIKIHELNSQYEYLKNEQNIALKKYYASLNEQKRKFDKKFALFTLSMKEKQALRDDLREYSNYIKKKMFNGRASQEDQKFILKLMEIQVKTYEDNFNLANAIVEVFSEDK